MSKMTPVDDRRVRIHKATKIYNEEHSKNQNPNEALHHTLYRIMDEIEVSDRKAKEYIKLIEEKNKLNAIKEAPPLEH
jgi:hypothetical protein